MTWLITSAEIKNNINAKPSATSNGALALRDETGRAAEAMGADVAGNFYNRVSTSSPASGPDLGPGRPVVTEVRVLRCLPHRHGKGLPRVLRRRQRCGGH